MNCARQPSGFTLIELTVVIVVLGIMGALSFAFVGYAVEGYQAQSRRAALVDDAQLPLTRMARDIANALPNSVRVTVSGTRVAIEMLNINRGYKYRDGAGFFHNGQYPVLRTGKKDSDFDVFAAPPATTSVLPGNDRLVVYNVGVPGADAYTDTGNNAVITPVGTTITVGPDTQYGDETHFNLNPKHIFPFDSPQSRIYLIDGPISYVCDTATGLLTRYDGYAIQGVQPLSDAAFATLGASSGVIAADVAGCKFRYSPGTAQRGAVVSLSLTLRQDGESVRLFEQVHSVNAV
jgi:MSHA biogenesis protein MshO